MAVLIFLFVGSNPTFSIPNPGTYEISFTSIDPCIDPPINNTHVISVLGYPIIDQTSIDFNQNCDLSAIYLWILSM